MTAKRSAIAADRLEGAEAIADYLGLPVRRVRYLVEIDSLPVGREGRGRRTGKIVASKRVLDEHWRKLTSGAAA